MHCIVMLFQFDGLNLPLPPLSTIFWQLFFSGECGSPRSQYLLLSDRK